MAGFRGRLVVAAPWTGSGKTTATLALIAGLKARGLRVQAFKCGPDYIDGTYHAVLTGRPVRNLDLWMGGPDDARQQVARGMQQADIGVVEGVMGLLDSGAPDGVAASTADVARAIGAPVVLVVDASRMAESVAAIVHGFDAVSGAPGIAGVILNRVASAGHRALLEGAIRRHTRVPVLGYLPETAELAMPERHLGLVPAVERQALAARMHRWAGVTQKTIDWDALLAIARGAAPAPTVPDRCDSRHASHPPVPVALARDRALHFYYPANLELLEELGAVLLPFSPVLGEPIPAEARMLYAGGGFPEMFLGELGRSPAVLAGYRERIQGGLLTLAECGGYMWLAESLAAGAEPVAMVGAVPATMTIEPRLQAIGYRTVSAQPGGPFPAGTTFRGHEFHHGRVVESRAPNAAWQSRSRGGPGSERAEGVLTATLVAGFTHLYLPSNPAAVAALLDQARAS